MNKKLKNVLKTAFNMPPPSRKSKFIMSMEFPEISQIGFICGQLSYMRKRIWILSCIPAVLSLLAFKMEESNVIWIVSAAASLLSLVGVAELVRSASCRMAELEMSCKYNFTYVLLARLTALAVANGASLSLAAVLLMGNVDFGFWRLGIYFAVPFLLVYALSFYMLNRTNSWDGVYLVCGGISLFMAVGQGFFGGFFAQLLLDKYLLFWVMLLCFLLLWSYIEVRRLIKKTEGLQWSLWLTT